MIRQIFPAELSASRAWTIIDVREYPEFAAGAIPGSRLVPLGGVEGDARDWDRDAAYALVCRSGRRATQAAATLAQMGYCNLAVLEGGFEAWRAAGLPVEESLRKPWSLERQVRVVAGSLVFVSTVLGLVLSPWFFAVSGFVGAGLVFAGVTDLCLMATLLGKLPWNRPRSKSAVSCPS